MERLLVCTPQADKDANHTFIVLLLAASTRSVFLSTQKVVAVSLSLSHANIIEIHSLVLALSRAHSLSVPSIMSPCV